TLPGRCARPTETSNQIFNYFRRKEASVPPRTPHAKQAELSWEGWSTSRLANGSGCRGLRSVPLALEAFVLDPELLALQIGVGLPGGKGTPILLIDGAFELGMLCFERLDAILQRHAFSSWETMTMVDGNPGCRSRPEVAEA